MADKNQLSLKSCTTISRAGASGLPMNGGEVFSPKPLQLCCTKVEDALTGEESAPKRKADAAGPKGSATKRKGGYEAAVAVAGNETMKQEDDTHYQKVHEECKAQYEALMQELFGGGAPHVRIMKYPSCMSYDGQDADEEELGVVEDEILPPVTN